MEEKKCPAPAIQVPFPRTAAMVRERRRLADIAQDPDALLAVAISEIGSGRGKLAASLLADSNSIRRLFKAALGMETEKKAEALRTVADELAGRPYNKTNEVTFIAMYGGRRNSERAIKELDLRGHMYGLIAAYKSAFDEENRALAYSRLWQSEKLVDAFLAASRAYRDSGYQGFLREFILKPDQLTGLDVATRRSIGIIRKLFRENGGSSWPEFQSDIAILPLAARVAAVAKANGRNDEACELVLAVMGRKLLDSIEPALVAKGEFTIEAMLGYLKKEACGQKLMKLLEEWMSIKDELLGSQFEILHELLGEELFLMDNEEQALLLLLPHAIRKLMAGGAENNLDVLTSPLLTEGEKEEATGLNERVARISLNLGLISTPLPEPFSDSAAFEKHMKMVVGVLREKYTDAEIREFAVNRTITAVMECTEFQKGMPHAIRVLQRLEAAGAGPADGSALEKEIIGEALGRLRASVEFHRASQESHGIDFYQSIRIKAFMDSRRILVADGTGTGKTIVALGSKCALDAQLAPQGKRAKVLILAPSTGSEASWGQEKMDQYCEKFGFRRQKVFLVRNRKDLVDFEARVAEADMVILGYGKLMNLEKNEYLDRILKIHFDAMIVDECHNIKNFSSYRGVCAKALLWRFRSERLLLLSATPLPNTINDGIGMLLYALDPERNHEAEKYKYNNDPQRVAEFWMGQRWFRRTLDDIKTEKNVREEVRDVDLSDEEADAYFELWRECAFTGIKFAKLQRFLIDGDLAEKHGVRNLRKLAALDAIIEDARANRKKVVVWTPWVAGVVDSLQDRYAHRGAVKIDGRVTSLEKRYKTAEAFRKSGFINVVIISRVADEGIDLSCGDNPVVLVRIVPPLTPRESVQTGGRVHRRTQFGQVEIITLVAKSERLTRLMLAFANEELAELGFTAPRGFMAQTIDRDVELLLKWKMTITEKVFRGERLSARQLDIWSAASIEQATSCLTSSLFQTMKNTPPFTKAIFIDQKFRQAGVEKIAEAMDGSIGRLFALLYEQGWEGSHSQHTHELIAGKIRKDHNLHPRGSRVGIADLGGGAAYASRALRYPTTLVDLNPHFLERARIVSSDLGIDNTLILGDMRKTGIEGKSMDATIASYSLHHMSQTQNERQVEEAVLEMNRMLKKGGKAYITIPWSAGEDALTRFARGLAFYGFNVDVNESGAYCPLFSSGKKGKKILLVVAKKESDCNELAPSQEWENFVIFQKRTRDRFVGDHPKRDMSDKKGDEGEEKKVVEFKKVGSIIL